jgi:hypothetical protein
MGADNVGVHSKIECSLGASGLERGNDLVDVVAYHTEPCVASVLLNHCGVVFVVVCDQGGAWRFVVEVSRDGRGGRLRRNSEVIGQRTSSQGCLCIGSHGIGLVQYDQLDARTETSKDRVKPHSGERQ